MSLSIAHLSFSQSGGAGSVAAILSEAQNSAGHQAEHLWSIEADLRSRPLSAPVHTVAAGVDHYLIRKGSFAAPISLLRDSIVPSHLQGLDNVDVIHVHNSNGVFDISDLSKKYSDKKIVWTLHDMNPFTATCHYSLGCSQFSGACSSCPAVKTAFREPVRGLFAKKQAAMGDVSNLQLVSPSEWLAEAASASTLMSRFPVSVIPNPIHNHFMGGPQANIKFSFCVVAKDLDDPVKNVQASVSAFTEAQRVRPELTLALIGGGGRAFAGPGITHLGHVSSEELATTLSESQALLVASLAENSPLAIAEAAAMGCIPIVRNVGGMPAMVEALGLGRVFSSDSELGGILRDTVLDRKLSGEKRQNIAERARALYSPAAIAEQYDEVYER